MAVHGKRGKQLKSFKVVNYFLIFFVILKETYKIFLFKTDLTSEQSSKNSLN